jgi:hypothetical protein
MLARLFLISFLLFCVGCGTTGIRAKGGKTSNVSSTGSITETSQPENPKEKAAQSTETETVKELIIPPGSTIQFNQVDINKAGKAVTNSTVVTVSSNTVMKTEVKEKSKSEVGGAQIDTVGAIVAKLKSARWMTIFGAVIFIAGLAAAFWPVTRTLLGGSTPGLLIAAGGIVLAGLPYIIIGNEKLIIGLVAGIGLLIIGGIFLYRHGGAGRENKVLREFIDLNKNGIDDREEAEAKKKK